MTAPLASDEESGDGVQRGHLSRAHRTPLPMTPVEGVPAAPASAQQEAFIQGAMAATLQGLADSVQRIEDATSRIGSKVDKTTSQYQEILRRLDAYQSRLKALEDKVAAHESAHEKTRGHILDVIKPLVTQALWAAAAFFAAMWVASANNQPKPADPPAIQQAPPAKGAQP